MIDYDLKDRVVIITGATGGIGHAIATEFYNQGAQIVTTGRDYEKLTALHDKLHGTTPNKNCLEPLCIPLDLTAAEAPETLIQETQKNFGRIDILINNAGRVDGRMFLKSDPLYLQNMVNINMLVPYNLCRLALPHMLRNKYGRIINMTSIAGAMGDAAMSAYAGSKGGMAAFTKSIAAEYGRRGITANCIAPGVIDTEVAQLIPPQRRKELRETNPMRRFGKPEEVADLALFLASNRATYINGQVIHINGGCVR